MVSPLSRKMNSPFSFIGTCFRTGRDIREFNLSIAENHLDTVAHDIRNKKNKVSKENLKGKRKICIFYFFNLNKIAHLYWLLYNIYIM